MSTEEIRCDWCDTIIPGMPAVKAENTEVFCSAACADAIEGCK